MGVRHIVARVSTALIWDGERCASRIPMGITTSITATQASIPTTQARINSMALPSIFDAFDSDYYVISMVS
jgi:hypothetical protein